MLINGGEALVLKWIKSIQMMFRKKGASNEAWSLLPLTAEYIPGEHGGYVATIEKALADGRTRNVALSGNYGVGKSSILREVARRQKDRVVELSLSTLAPIDVSELDESVPAQATTPTNRIQQEIVKQLLYREKPRKTPRSRFRRIERFRWLREIGTALLAGFVGATIFFLTGWTSQISAEFLMLGELGARVHLVVWGVGSGAALLTRSLFYGKLHITKLSAGSATVTLDDRSVSYFDQYLDEIVYFFEVSRRDIAIFEDIDRFNDSHIFETLRALNTLLNSSPQFKNKPIRFIYAIKDSIFDRVALEEEGRQVAPDIPEATDPAQAEAARANRTKFFDLVIPVVPFITHRSARDVAKQLLDKFDHNVDFHLLDIAAKYIPDMRLLKNVCNEFVIFRDRIFSGNGALLDLNETDLFAMMLYKNTHLADFEKIRLGTSNLDLLYRISRELVADNIKRIEGERLKLRQTLSKIDGVATRSKQLGERLIAHIKGIVGAITNWREEEMTFQGKVLAKNELMEANFWKCFTAVDGDQAVLRVKGIVDNRRLSLSFTRVSLVEALGDPLDVGAWIEADREQLIGQLDGNAEDIKFLRSAGLSDLMKRPEFFVKFEQDEKSLDAVAKTLLKPGLAYQLVHAGHINNNFTLYTATFHGDRVPPAAMNFIIHHVERDLMDEYFELGPEDVEAVVRELGNNSLKEPALYNIAILDYLLTADVDAADIMIRSLVSFGEYQLRFLKAYLSAGNERKKCIGRLTTMSGQVVMYLISQADLDDASRLELVNVALANLSASKQQTDAAVSGYLAAYYAEFSVLTSDTTDTSMAERIGALFRSANAIVDHLEPLAKNVRLSFVSRSLYKITSENLSIAINNTETLALDVIRSTAEIVYEYMLANLGAYLDAIEGGSASVEEREYFVDVLEDVLAQDPSCLDEVVKRADPDCMVIDLSEVSQGAWEALAEHKRFPAAFGNVSSYVDAFGFVDEKLAAILSDAGKIPEAQGGDEESKSAVAIAILAAGESLPSASLRAKLAESLHLGDYLDVGDINPEASELFAQLLKHDIIADERTSYEHIAEADWLTRKAFICESKKFTTYMTPGMVSQDLYSLLSSDEVDSSIKEQIIKQAEEYAEATDHNGLLGLAQFAVQCGNELSLAVVEKMALGGVAAKLIIPLLEPHLSSISREQLFTVLHALGGEYAKLTAVGRDQSRIPNTSADRALLERLKQEGIVSRYREQESSFRVYKKHKQVDNSDTALSRG